jgi:hypothetical protein
MIKAAILMCVVSELSAEGWGQSILGVRFGSGPGFKEEPLSDDRDVAGWLDPTTGYP